MAKLKVYRTPIGFQDAYVAAPSQKAALAAWGSDADLFARGVAEVVTDAALTKAPLAAPGEVIKVSRGSAAEQMAALPADAPKRAKAKAAKPTPARQPKRAAKPKPRPSRAKLDAAEAALADAEENHRGALAELAKEEAALARRKRALVAEQEKERAKLEKARARVEGAYDRAINSAKRDNE